MNSQQTRRDSQQYPFNERKISSLVGEKCEDIEGYEGLYQVSNAGRIKSLSRFLEIEIPRIKKEIKDLTQTELGRLSNDPEA